MNVEPSVDVLQHRNTHLERPPLLERRGGAVLVVLLLTFGAFVAPVVGWLIGIVLLWRSPGWRRLDKAVGTAAGPIALVVPVLLRVLHLEAASSGCNGSGFCTPSFNTAWYHSMSTIGTWLFVVHLALGVYLLLRFRAARTSQPRPTTPR